MISFLLGVSVFITQPQVQQQEQNSIKLINELKQFNNERLSHKKIRDMKRVKKKYIEKGIASFYGKEEDRKLTATGEVFHRFKMTAASNTIKMGSHVKVTNVENGKSIEVRINDTGGFSKLKVPRIIDLSEGAFGKIGNKDRGLISVVVETDVNNRKLN